MFLIEDGSVLNARVCEKMLSLLSSFLDQKKKVDQQEVDPYLSRHHPGTIQAPSLITLSVSLRD